MATLPGPALTIAVLLCPAIIFYVAEQNKGHPVSRAMLLCGSTTILQPLRQLWDHDGRLASALDLLANPECPLLAWIACGAGWLLCELAHAALHLSSRLSMRRKIQTLERERSELRAEWMTGGGP